MCDAKTKESGLKSFNIWVRSYLFLKKCTLFHREPFLTLYYQLLYMARYEVSFYANNYFE